MRRIWFLAAVCLLPGLASAEPSTFELRGTVLEVDTHSGIFDPSIGVGTRVSASFTVDPELLTLSRQVNPAIPFIWEHLGVIVGGDLLVGPDFFQILSNTSVIADDIAIIDGEGPFDSWSTGLLPNVSRAQASIGCGFDTSLVVNPALFFVPSFEDAILCRAVVRITSTGPADDLLVADVTLIVGDRDGDGIGDEADVCPDWPDPDQLDADGNGTGDACECGDQDGNGTLNVLDLLAINEVIFEVQAASELCDANDDGLCNVGDIIAVNAALFGTPTSCARRPAP